MKVKLKSLSDLAALGYSFHSGRPDDSFRIAMSMRSPGLVIRPDMLNRVLDVTENPTIDISDVKYWSELFDLIEE